MGVDAGAEAIMKRTPFQITLGSIPARLSNTFWYWFGWILWGSIVSFTIHSCEHVANTIQDSSSHSSY